MTPEQQQLLYLLLPMLGFGIVAAVVIYIVAAIFLMRVFAKAGVDGGWRAWVPVYNTMIFYKLGDLNPWLVVIGFALALIPFLNFFVALGLAILMTMAAWRIGLKLQKEVPWIFLFIFLGLVWLGINAFDRSRWNVAVPRAPWANNGFFGDRTTWNGIPSQIPGGGFPQDPGMPPAAPAA